MEWEDGLKRINQLLSNRTGNSLSEIETVLCKAAWLGQSYEFIAETTNYSVSYLSRTLGPRLWQRLSTVLGEPVTKKSLRVCVERWVAQQSIPVVSQALQTAQIRVPSPRICDWGEAIDVASFYGRQAELNTLQQWIENDRCRLVTILGMGGIGKTALSVKLAHQIQEQFEFVVWRSLRNAPPLENLLADLIAILSRQQDVQLPDSIPARLYRLLSYLKQHRCLLVLDNSESVLQVGAIDSYLPQYEGYGELLRQIGEENHQSCLILTGREEPIEVATLAADTAPVRILKLQGLSATESNFILCSKGLLGSDLDRQHLNEMYCGNPLALKIVATSIRELFEGSIAEFLQEGTVVFNSIRLLLDQQFERLSTLEKQVMYWLAIHREWVAVSALQKDIVPLVSRVRLSETLDALERRSLLERYHHNLTQQPVVMEYMTEKLIEQFNRELANNWTEAVKPLIFFQSYALIKADTKDYIRLSQTRLLLQPIARKLQEAFPSFITLQNRMANILKELRAAALPSGYGAGNLLNLIVHLNLDPTGFDFSNLLIRQAYLQGANLSGVNFSHAHFEQSVFTQTCGNIWSVAFSPDGQLLVTGDSNCHICIWRIADEQLLLTCKGHTSWVLSVAWSPDGNLLASGGNDSTLRLWNSKTGECLHLLQNHTGWVWTVVWSPDGMLLASGSQDLTIKLWDRHTGQCIKTLLGHTGLVSSIAWSPDGKLLATGSHDQTIRFWDVATGQCIRTIQTKTTGVLSIAWSPDGKTVASASYEPIIQLWEIMFEPTSASLMVEYRQQLEGHTAWISSVKWSPDGKTLASASCDATIRIWHPFSSTCLKVLQGHRNWIYTIAWSPNGQNLASGSQDQTLRLWETPTGQPLTIFQGHANGCFALDYHPAVDLLAAAFQDQTIRIWHTTERQWLQVLQGHQNLIWSMVWSPDGKLLATGSQDQMIKLWNVTSGQCRKTLQGHQSVVRSLSWHPNGQLLASAAQDQTVRIWDVETGNCWKTLEVSELVWSVAWSPDGCTLACGGHHGTIKLWDLATESYRQMFEEHTDVVYTTVWSPDGQTLASGSQDCMIKLWDMATETCLYTLSGHTNLINSISWSPDGTKFVSASHDQTLRLWSYGTEECLYTLTEHTGLIFSVIWDSTNHTLISGSSDGTIKTWNPNNGKCIRTLKIDRPYEAMNLTGATGLTEAQKETLKQLGAIEHGMGAGISMD